MIRLFSPETFRDYLENPEPSSLWGNGSIVLEPSECVVNATIGDDWTLTMKHDLDENNRYSYIEKNAILVVDVYICREQTTAKQAFRILEVSPGDDSIEVTAYPVAWESIYEFPINETYENYTIRDIIAQWNSQYSNKYQVDTTYLDDSTLDYTVNLYVENSNLQEVLNSESGNTIRNLLNGSELVYDNYTYHLLPNEGIGEDLSGDITVKYGTNMAGIEWTESMSDVITRIIPLSSEGYHMVGTTDYIDSTNIDEYPHVFAKYETYSDIKLVDYRDENDTTDSSPWTDTQIMTREVRANIEAKVRELSEKYLRKARQGDWDHHYPSTPPINNNPHEPGREYDQNADRAALPYGYLFYSYTDVIGLLTQKMIERNNITDSNYKDLITSAIKAGFKWCETTEIAGWDWRYETYYSSDDGDGFYDYLPNYAWYQDETGWFYGDNAGEGHYIKSGWVEDSRSKHYWCNAEGYWDPQWDDDTDWNWYNDGTGWWYGSKNEDGTTKNYASNQWIFDSGSNNWYLIDSSGYLMDGKEKKWWYGTEDRSDTVQFKYWHIGNYIYWLDANAYANEELIYWSDFQWREDDVGYYYGDGKGHYVTSAWIEESESKHYWVDEDGYRDDSKTDSNQWCWHGNWDDGFWYGTKEDDDDDDDTPTVEKICKQVKRFLNSYESYTKATLIANIEAQCNRVTYSSDSTIGHIVQECENYTGSGTYEDFRSAVQSELDQTSYDYSNLGTITVDGTCEDIKSVVDNPSSYTKKTMRTKIKGILNDGPVHTSGSTLGLIEAVVNNTTYDKSTMVDKIKGYLEDAGYYDDDDSDSSVSVTRSSSNDSEDDDSSDDEETITKINYPVSQFMYVSGNGTWYWFDANGYFTAAWMVDDDQWNWNQDSIGWWYGDGSGSYPTGQWMKINSKWYFFDVTGYADPGTDDFEDTKTSDSNSATYDSNREGVGSSSSESSEEVIYDENREGVKAWLQEGFLTEMDTCIRTCTEMLNDCKDSQLADLAANDLAVLCQPTISISINFNTLYETPQYEQYSYLQDLFLGDQVYCEHDLYGLITKERITGIKYDCILEKISEMTFQTVAYQRSGWVKQLANTTAKTGTIIKYNLQDALEDGYGGYLKTGYGVDLTTL